jgi:hypothetical protein
MARTHYKRIDGTSDRKHDNGDRTRTYNVFNGADDSIVGTVAEHWHANAFRDDASIGSVKGIVDMSLYKNSIADGRRSLTGALKNGKRVDVSACTTLANAVATVARAAGVKNVKNSK